MSRHNEAIKLVSCPKCKAKKTNPCVYIQPKILPLYKDTYETKQRLSRVGQPTKVPHNERLWKLYRLERKQRQEIIIEQKTQGKALWEVRKSYADSIRQEQTELTNWLRQYGKILL